MKLQAPLGMGPRALLTLLLIKALANELGRAYLYTRTPTPRATGTVVPWPRILNYTRQTRDHLLVEPASFQIVLDEGAAACPIIRRAVDRYTRAYLFDDVAPLTRDLPPGQAKAKSLGKLTRLLVETPKGFVCEQVPSLEMEEAYSLRVVAVVGGAHQRGGSKETGWARLSARSNWGLMRGLETLSQLIYNLKPKLFAVRPVEIEDEPRFRYRGYMLDTARHYLELPIILRTLDAMSFNKLNVFHWHMVDDQSFPFVSSNYPQLSAHTSFRPHMVYTPDQVKLVVEYAADRGIRVLPELDTPGHTYALRVLKGVLTECYDLRSQKPNGDLGPVDPTKLGTFKVVSRLLSEFSALFPDQYFHAGADEVDFGCWKSNPEIAAWMEARNMSGDYARLNKYYLGRLYDLLAYQNRTMTVWQEVLDEGTDLPKEVVVQAWKQSGSDRLSELRKIVSAGYRGILSSCWYLNWINYGQDWVKFYQCDPTGGDPVLEAHSELVLGGEVCMWSEFVDETNVIPRTWPRTSAAAERLWSPRTLNNSDSFLERLEQMRCRLRFRNIQAEPVNGPGYC